MIHALGQRGKLRLQFGIRRCCRSRAIVAGRERRNALLELFQASVQLGFDLEPRCDERARFVPRLTRDLTRGCLLGGRGHLVEPGDHAVDPEAKRTSVAVESLENVVARHIVQPALDLRKALNQCGIDWRLLAELHHTRTELFEDVASLERLEPRGDIPQLLVERGVAHRSLGDCLHSRTQLLERSRELVGSRLCLGIDDRSLRELVHRRGQRIDALSGRRIGIRLLVRQRFESRRKLIHSSLDGGVGQRTLCELGERALELVQRVGVSGETLHSRGQHIHAISELDESHRKRVDLRDQLLISTRTLTERLDDCLEVFDLGDEVGIASRTLTE